MIRQISVAIISLMFFIPTLLFAHGSFTHVLGTVTEATEDQIVVQTIKGGVVTLTVTPETIYQHNGITTKDIRPEVGNRNLSYTFWYSTDRNAGLG